MAARMILFVLSISAGFVYICNVIPQLKSEPVAVKTLVGETPEELAAVGQRIFMSDRAQCLTCHSLGKDPKARCPNQEGLGEKAAQRRIGMSGAAYLVESVYNPNAYIVPGYPKNQMRPINKPPIALTHDEILAVVIYLNTLGGVSDAEFLDKVRKAQDPWRRGVLKANEREDSFRPPIFAGDPNAGQEVFDRQCVRCHRIGTKGQNVGPELTQIGATQTEDYVLESILEPSTVIVRGYKKTIVRWKRAGRESVRGTALEWLPDKEHPQTLRLGILELDTVVETEIDLSEATCVGDTVVVVKDGNDTVPLCGEYVSGDEQTGVTLTFLEGGVWVERKIDAGRIALVNEAMSPMPSNFAELIRPQQVYDLVAYLIAQKGEP